VHLAPDEIARLQPLLSPDEAARAARFRFERDRSAFIARRGILRLILGRYLGGDAFREAFEMNAYGKPRIPNGLIGDDLRFSASHSAGTALIAVARGREVGVDVEAMRGDIDPSAIAQRFFSPYEQTILSALAHGLRREAFFTCWSRKEAYVKARGMGLSIPLDQFDVSFAPGEPARLIATRDDPLEAARWSMVALDPGAGFAGALVVEGEAPVVTCLQWADP
jgi:4'-phosphopantetheinyl transferase